jgi:hypothetical protein
MDALEPAIRKDPEHWVAELDDWLRDENKWLRRVAVTIYGRLPMKHQRLLGNALQAASEVLYDEVDEVRKATSFAIRLCAKIDAKEVCSYLREHIPPKDTRATWVLCDVIRSMGSKQLPGFVTLLPAYKDWMKAQSLNAKDRRSIASAIKKLEGVNT